MNTLIYILTGLAVVFAIAAIIGYGIDKYFDRRERFVAKCVKAASEILQNMANNLEKAVDEDND